MIVGMWNKSVILTYIGLAAAVFGICLSVSGSDLKFAMVCLIISGVADLFDGAVARRVKRTEEEKEFGIQIDSLVDVVSFIALPITILICAGMNKPYHFLVFILFALCGIARLGYFNVATADMGKAVKYYTGLPVTYVALIFPLIYLAKLIVNENIFVIIITVSVLIVSAFEILKVKVIKPRGAAYAVFSILAIAMLAVYLFVV